MPAFRILSIDGGGIRGVIPAIWLAKIAQKLKKPLHEYFDLIVGTSTGSILAAAIALEKDPKDCADLYETYGPEIFPGELFEDKNAWERFIEKAKDWFSPAYQGEPLASALQKIFAADTLLGQTKTDTMIVSYDVLGRAIFIMKSYDESMKHIPVWEACKASCSAPTYFPAHVLTLDNIEKPLIDGGIFANNPSMLGLSEAIKIRNAPSIRRFQQTNQIKLLSLGTGNMIRRISIKDATSWGAIQWVRPLIDVMFDSTAELSNMCAQHIITPENYIRVQVDLHGVNDDMDDASSKNIGELKAIASTHLESGNGGIILDNIVTLLTES